MAVFNEMEVVIKDIVTRSFADSSYPKAIKALQAYRAEAIDVSTLLDRTDWVVG
jgi:Ku C terminal domain like